MGISVSVMRCDDDGVRLEDEDKNIFDWCKEGSLKNVRQLLAADNHVDSEVCQTALYLWASRCII